MKKVSPEPYWNCSEEVLLSRLHTTKNGLSREKAIQTLEESTNTNLPGSQKTGKALLFLRQLNSPITIILVIAASLSFFLREHTNGTIILTIILISATLSFFQENSAANALKKLLSLVQIRVRVLRDGIIEEIPIEKSVKGDIIFLSAGNTVPGDCRLLDSNNLFLNEATLTGETFPAEKKCCTLPLSSELSKRVNVLFMGTHVISGTAKAVIVSTGSETEFGKISQQLRLAKPETEFEKEIRLFGYLLMKLTVLLVVFVFLTNILLHKPVLESFLFSLAIAIGLTPQLLPAIITINLSKGASEMARQQVIVKRLAAIENFGGMNVLCCDKTGTLTQGKITIYKAVDYAGEAMNKVIQLAYLNAFFETGFTNPIDDALRGYIHPDTASYSKKSEIPYDFIRKRISVLLSTPANSLLITKGAFDEVLSICTLAENKEGSRVQLETIIEDLRKEFARYSAEGYRIIALACREFELSKSELFKSDETSMVFLGILLLADPPKSDAAATLENLKSMGISLKIITGDNQLIASYISKEIGIPDPVILSGNDLRDMSSEALIHRAPLTDVFAEIEPNQKERILSALKKAGNVVGFIGDGINDAPALHTADVGICVNGAADVAKDASDIVLLADNLNVLVNGVTEGRKTFANTLKYIFMATSANFGNMFSMAGSSLLLPFLPLLPRQVLLVNLLTDIPEMTIASDRVDARMTQRPQLMNLSFIKKFMITFGIISSLFDFVTFSILLYILKTSVIQFRTGWFIESVVSASVIVLVIRTSGSFVKSRPGKYLLITTLLTMFTALILPALPFASLLGFAPVSIEVYVWIIIIVTCYIILTEIVKNIFYRQIDKKKSKAAR